MLSRLRQHRSILRPLAAALAVLVLAGSAEFWHVERVNDPDVAAALVVHDHAAHRLQAAVTGTRPGGHCALCHWLRSLGTVVAASGPVLPAPRARFAVHHEPLLSSSRLLIHQAGARSPPA